MQSLASYLGTVDVQSNMEINGQMFNNATGQRATLAASTSCDTHLWHDNASIKPVEVK